MKKQNYEFMSAMVLSLLNADHLFTYDFIAHELNISRTSISSMKQGKDMPIHHYLSLINYTMEIIDLKIDLGTLLKQIKKVLAEDRNLVVGTVPHHAHEKCIPDDWEEIICWEKISRSEKSNL